jgi:hypothetical protein
MANNKKPRHIVDEKEAQLYNMRRMNNNGKSLNLTEFKELLRDMKYLTSPVFIKCFTSGVNPPFIKVSRGEYAFAKEPIYQARLQSAWDDFQSYGKMKTSDNPLQIKVAIELLKKNGYRVLKPTTQWQEV